MMDVIYIYVLLYKFISIRCGLYDISGRQTNAISSSYELLSRTYT